jgi:hypothetical protein
MWSMCCGFSSSVDGKIRGSQVQAYCKSLEENSLTVDADIMVCLRSFSWQLSGTVSLVTRFKWTVSDVPFLHMIADVYKVGEYTMCSVSVSWNTVSFPDLGSNLQC